MSESVTSSPAPNDDKPLVRVFEKRELLSQVLDLVGEGTEIAAMLVCKAGHSIIMQGVTNMRRSNMFQCLLRGHRK